MPRRFYTVDVFAQKKYAGNQLAVVRDCVGLTDAEMQLIAKEMNYNETTFIIREEPESGGFNVRIFTPAEEVPFAGHPTLGTAYVIQQEILRLAVDAVTLNLKVGPITVTFTYRDGKPDVLWMRQIEPEFGETVSHAAMAALLQLSPADLDTRFAPQEVSTGLPFFIVPLRTLDAVRRAAPETKQLLRFVAPYTAKNILVFAPETYEAGNDFNARVFTDYLGIPEDPATGSANGCLAAYLVKHRYLGEPRIRANVEQGYEIKRPSQLRIHAEAQGKSIAIHVGGRVIPVARGELV
ncbi:MAG: Trans-2,3-dihydro-3-hydroxyanthranilate isomerase [Firmicutes bacterium]|nr:Trans-2,3-dihydro-3-hydroxyanthranilate isomerase [candidate division NPL-UPA2 bacterium]